jgi:hypothetical protein
MIISWSKGTAAGKRAWTYDGSILDVLIMIPD